MMYLDEAQLSKVDFEAFHRRRPYPWLNPQGWLKAEGYRQLIDHAPSIELFRPVFGKARKHGQQSHDRFVLDYTPTLSINECWHRFLEELRSEVYLEIVRALLGQDDFTLRLHWHYTPTGCSVSPHCDAPHKLGSHIFYLNESANWNPSWGGQTIILDDGGRFPPRSNPDFSDFQCQLSMNTLDNHSLFFSRNGNSWHGVETLRCPPGELRKVFIVVFERRSGWSGAINNFTRKSRR